MTKEKGGNILRLNLIKARKKKGYTQQEMANKLNIARTTYTGYENGTFSPSFEKALEIKKILKTKSDNIFLINNDSTTAKRGTDREEE